MNDERMNAVDQAGATIIARPSMSEQLMVLGSLDYLSQKVVET